MGVIRAPVCAYGRLIQARRNRQTFAVFLFLVFFPVFAGAAPFTMISAGDPALEDLRFLVVQSGKSFLSLTPPLSRDEVLLILEDIDTDALSPAGWDAYNRIQDALNPKPLYSSGLFNMNAHIMTGVETRARTNPAVLWTQNQKDSPSLLELSVHLSVADRVQLVMEPIVARSMSYYDEYGPYFGTNIPFDLGHETGLLPLRAFLATGGSWWNFEIGRDRLSYGLGRTGDLALSDTPDYYDMARFSLFLSMFKYSVLVSQMPLMLERIAPNVSENVLSQTTQRHLYAHRVDVRLFRRLSLGLTEGMMVGNSPLEVRFLNPFTIFHSFAAWRNYGAWTGTDLERADMVGSLFSLDVQWAVLPAFSLYGQFVMNEWATPYEREDTGTLAPNATGFLAGAEYVRDVAGWAASFYAECLYTDPYLYMLSTPFASYIWMRSDSAPLRYSWIGHPEGRDTIMYAAGTSFSKENLGFSLNVSFVQKGIHTLQWEWGMGPAYSDQRTPSGIPEHKLSLAIGATWKPLAWMEVSAQAGGSMIDNHAHTSGIREYGLDAMMNIRFIY
jgi:hypothetical protein